MMKNSVMIAAAVLLGVLLFRNNAASVPLEFTHQGRLLDAAGMPANGFFDIVYDLYPSATGGTSLWTETHNGVEVKDGLFIVELGSIATFFDVFPDPPPPGWLEIQIVGEATPMSPRTKLSGSPYAILANGVSSQHVFMSGGQVYTASADMGVTDSAASLRLRIIPTAQTTGRIAMDVTRQGSELSIGDPDFDLLRMTGDATGAHMSMTGDPDFDLLRLSADADSAKIRISGQSIGDPDFDLIRISGGGGSGGSGGEIKITGDPDFDLLRLSANADSAEITMSAQDIGDPDFDLLRMIGKPKLGEITMQVKNSIGTIRGITTEVDSASASYHYYHWSSGGVKRNMIAMRTDDETGTMTISNAAGTKGMASRVNNSGGSIAIEEEGVQKIRLDTDSAHAEIAVNEEGVQITMRADSGGGGSIAIDEEGLQKIVMSTGGSSSSIAVNEEGTHNITISVDSGGLANIGINETIPDTKKVSFDSDGDGYLAGTLGMGVLAPIHPIQLTSGAHVTAGGVWTNASDKNLKENFEEVDGEALLEKIESLDINEWNYKIESEDIKHIGPTAQDFYKAFGVGGDDKTISTVDPSGIALAAIKELYKKSKEVDELKKQLDELTKAVEKLAKEKK